MFSDRLHLTTVYHLDYSRYHLVFLTMICTPVACASHEKISSPDWLILIFSFLGAMREVAILVIMESIEEVDSYLLAVFKLSNYFNDRIVTCALQLNPRCGSQRSTC